MADAAEQVVAPDASRASSVTLLAIVLACFASGKDHRLSFTFTGVDGKQRAFIGYGLLR